MKSIPAPYSEHFSGGGPREGALSVDPGWFQLWAPGDIARLNESYKVSEYAPGLLGFGSSGGGELFAFDQFERVFRLPLVGMSLEHALQVAESWDDFAAMMVK